MRPWIIAAAALAGLAVAARGAAQSPANGPTAARAVNGAGAASGAGATAAGKATKAVPAARATDAPAPQQGAPGAIPGLIRNTVGFTVPMPGTEMIRVGAVQEGATLQAANRHPSLEGFHEEGVTRARRARLEVLVRLPRP